MIKSIFETIIILLILPFVILIHSVIYIVIKITYRSSVIYKQKRLGKNKNIFYIYKYKTFFDNQEELLIKYLKQYPLEKENYKKYHKYTNDPRATKVGRFLRKTSFDELPQIYNILLGNMSLIGPRPYMLSERHIILKNKENNIIFNIKPAITGLWQVSGRNKLSFSKRLELDRWYVKNNNIWMDIIIVFKTIKVVFINE
jgi:undecaprenyl-phosphate galactose phosphotransferase